MHTTTSPHPPQQLRVSSSQWARLQAGGSPAATTTTARAVRHNRRHVPPQTAHQPCQSLVPEYVHVVISNCDMKWSGGTASQHAIVGPAQSCALNHAILARSTHDDMANNTPNLLHVCVCVHALTVFSHLSIGCSDVRASMRSLRNLAAPGRSNELRRCDACGGGMGGNAPLAEPSAAAFCTGTNAPDAPASRAAGWLLVV